MPNLRLKRHLLEVVENQLRDNNPKETRETLEALRKLGFSDQEAKERIATAVTSEIFDILHDGKEYDEARYIANLRTIAKGDLLWGEEEMKKAQEDVDAMEDVWDASEDSDQEINDWNWLDSDDGELMQGDHDDFWDLDSWPETDDSVLQQIQLFQELYAEENYDEAVNVFKSSWQDIWECICDINFPEGDRFLKKPSVLKADDRTDYKYMFTNYIQDVEMVLHNAWQNEMRLDFCKKMLEEVDWSYNSDDVNSQEFSASFREGVAESYSYLERYDELEAFLKKWETEYPDEWQKRLVIQTEALNRQGKLREAAQLAIDHLPTNLEKTMDNEILISRVEWFFERNQIKEGEQLCKTIKNNWKKRLVRKVSDKIYPNDPCPCGSGKKYKKCCGR